MVIVKNPAKILLRQHVKRMLKQMEQTDRREQSNAIAKKVISSPAFRQSSRISIYLSTNTEVDTLLILKEIFHQKKQAFIPYYKGDTMSMVRLDDMDDFERLPLTKWHIKQPHGEEQRENANDTGGLDLIIVPGVAFSSNGSRMGHGMGYYDRYFGQLFTTCPSRAAPHDLRGHIAKKLNAGQTVLMGLAFRQQLIDEERLPLDDHDVGLDQVVTADSYN